MRFLLSVYTESADVGGAGRDAVREQEGFLAEVSDSGELIDGQLVADALTSSVVRVRDGVRSVVGGPVVGSPLQLAAYYLVDCENRQRAEELAASCPAARHDVVEVRPVMTNAGLEM